MSMQEGSVGKLGFIETHGLWNAEQHEAAKRVTAEIEQHDLRTIRIAWGDQHGIVRGKNVMSHDFLLALKNGVDFQTATLFMDTSNHLFAPMFSSDAGLGMTAGHPDLVLEHIGRMLVALRPDHVRPQLRPVHPVLRVPHIPEIPVHP